MRKEITTMARKIARTPVNVIQAACFVLLAAILISWPISVLAQQRSSYEQSEQDRMTQGMASLDKEIAVLQQSVTQHHIEQDSQHFPERVAVLEARMGSVDNKLNMILGALVTLTIACIADFIRRIRLEREPAGTEG